jgi:hypothetical protein
LLAIGGTAAPCREPDRGREVRVLGGEPDAAELEIGAVVEMALPAGEGDVRTLVVAGEHEPADVGVRAEQRDEALALALEPVARHRDPLVMAALPVGPREQPTQRAIAALVAAQQGGPVGLGAGVRDPQLAPGDGLIPTASAAR